MKEEWSETVRVKKESSETVRVKEELSDTVRVKEEWSDSERRDWGIVINRRCTKQIVAAELQ